MAHRHMDLKIGTEAKQFLIPGIFVSTFRYCVFAIVVRTAIVGVCAL